MRLLALETAVEACSVALWQDGLVCSRFVHAPRQQTALLLPMVESLLNEAGWSLSSLDVLAYSAGPGAFSGVRLGAAAVQGLALGLDKPVVAVSSLQVLAQGVWRTRQMPRVLSIFDARMDQVYAAAFVCEQGQMQRVSEDRLLAPEQVEVPAGAWFVAGNGWVYRDRLAIHSMGSDEQALPDAQDVAALAAGWAEQGAARDAAEALPVYLRHDVWKKMPGR